MVYKRVFLFFLILLAFYFVLPVHAYENEEPEDPMAVRDSIGEDLSGKTDVELVGMERELKAKLGLEPGNADLYYRLSTVYATLFDRTRTQKGNQSLEWLVKSRDALEKVLMMRPEDKVAHYNLGVVYKRLGQMERAREELKKGIRLCDPGHDAYLLCASWLQIGSVYEEQGFFEEAKEAYLKAREFDYENQDIQEALRDVDAKRKAPEQGGGSSFGMPFMGNSLSSNPQTAAAMGQDPNAQNQSGIAQALPALGQALMQKFGGGGGGEDTSGQNR
ncbi:MAG: tetratricopeptide repeat protein [Candidatus Omnitrophica bacterium]|nr:tetratricopeptide repeat protein [Candidatus Omnitrophota bacterium]